MKFLIASGLGLLLNLTPTAATAQTIDSYALQPQKIFEGADEQIIKKKAYAGLVIEKVIRTWTMRETLQPNHNQQFKTDLEYVLVKSRYRIVDRKKYVQYKTKEGAKAGLVLGALIGTLLGIIGLVSTPLGYGALILIPVLALLGRHLWSNYAKRRAKVKREVFSETVTDQFTRKRTE